MTSPLWADVPTSYVLNNNESMIQNNVSCSPNVHAMDDLQFILIRDTALTLSNCIDVFENNR